MRHSVCFLLLKPVPRRLNRGKITVPPGRREKGEIMKLGFTEHDEQQFALLSDELQEYLLSSGIFEGFVPSNIGPGGSPCYAWRAMAIGRIDGNRRIPLRKRNEWLLELEQVTDSLELVAGKLSYLDYRRFWRPTFGKATRG